MTHPRRDPELIKAKWNEGLKLWRKSLPEGRPLPGSVARQAYEINERAGFDYTIEDLPKADRVLVVGGGPSAAKVDIIKTIYDFEPDQTLLCKNHLHEIMSGLTVAAIAREGVPSTVVDAEIDVHWQLIDYPDHLQGIPVVWNACIMRVLDPKKIYWARFKCGGVSESFESPLPRIPYRTSAEAALWLAMEKMGAKRVGCIGIECTTDEYRGPRSDVIEIFEQHPNVKIVDYSGRGVVWEWTMVKENQEYIDARRPKF